MALSDSTVYHRITQADALYRWEKTTLSAGFKEDSSLLLKDGVF
jgi:hypothetical protein